MYSYVYLVFLHLAIIPVGEGYKCIRCDGFINEQCNFPFVKILRMNSVCDASYCSIEVWFPNKERKNFDPTNGVVRRWCGGSRDFPHIYDHRVVYSATCKDEENCNAEDRPFVDQFRGDSSSTKLTPHGPLLIVLGFLPLVVSSLC